LVNNDWRTFCGFAIEFFFAFGECLVGVLALFIKDWWKLQLVISVPIVIFFIYWLYVPESPRWLAAQGRQDEAEKILRKAAKFNGKVFPDDLLKLPQKNSQGSEQLAVGSTAEMSIVDLFRRPVLRRRTIIVMYQWLVTAMVYYGLALNATNLGGNVYLNFILVQIVDWPSLLCCILLFDPWGRKLCTSLGFFIGGFGSIASGLVADVEGLETLTVVFALIGKFGAAACFAIVFVYGAELFPTDLRNSGIGLSSAAGRIGSILAPFISSLGADSQILPMSIFGGLSVVAGLLTLLLPETYGENLPTTLDEAENFGSDQPLCFVPCVVRRRKTQTGASE